MWWQPLQVIPGLQNSGYVQFQQGQVISIPANYAVQQSNGQFQLISSQPKQIPSNQLATNTHMFTNQGKQVIAAPSQPSKI